MRLTIAVGHALILHDMARNQAFRRSIVQFGIVRTELGTAAKRNEPCSDPFGDRSESLTRRVSNNATRKIRAHAT